MVQKMDHLKISCKNDFPEINEHKVSEKQQPAVYMKNSIGMEFVLVPAGDFWMYSHYCSHKGPVHKVVISEPFYLGKYPVTQKEWELVMGNHPSCFEGGARPVECVSWIDVQEFIKRMNAKEDTDKYRLPTESEWEYACRARTTTIYSFGDAESKLGKYAWYYGNAENQTHPVGQKKPNPWGLYDMHGNVWEWCQDRCIINFHQNYEKALPDDRTWKVDSISGIALRGGSWVNYARKCRSAYRSNFNSEYGSYSLGFRLLRQI